MKSLHVNIITLMCPRCFDCNHNFHSTLSPKTTDDFFRSVSCWPDDQLPHKGFLDNHHYSSNSPVDSHITHTKYVSNTSHSLLVCKVPQCQQQLLLCRNRWATRMSAINHSQIALNDFKYNIKRPSSYTEMSLAGVVVIWRDNSINIPKNSSSRCT